MIPADVLKRKSLFSLLYQIDKDLTERTRAKGCPFAGVGCIVPIISESLGAGLLILMRLSRSVSVYVAATPDAGAVYCRHRFGSGVAGYIGRQWFYWSRPFARVRIRPSRLNVSRGCAGSGDRQSNGGNAIFEIFFPKVSAFDVWPDALCPQSVRTNCPENYYHDFTKWTTTPSRRWPIAWQRLFWARDGPP